MTTARHPVFTWAVTGIDVTPRDLLEVLGDAIGRKPTTEELRQFQSYMNRSRDTWLEDSAAQFVTQYI